MYWGQRISKNNAFGAHQIPQGKWWAQVWSNRKESAWEAGIRVVNSLVPLPFSKVNLGWNEHRCFIKVLNRLKDWNLTLLTLLSDYKTLVFVNHIGTDFDFPHGNFLSENSARWVWKFSSSVGFPLSDGRQCLPMVSIELMQPIPELKGCFGCLLVCLLSHWCVYWPCWKRKWTLNS